ncbi:MAG: ISL3 family transposase [Actinomycetota bacterium]|nr:ISL3 family transposase [Actinomycetota bacterium]
MRVETAFNRMLRLPGGWVRDVQFGAEVVVTVALRRRRATCAGCGARRGLQVHDRRVKRWRHLDLGASRCLVECELRRLRCAGCRRLGLEAVPWARADAPYTRDFEDLTAWLAQQMAKTQICALLRIGWATVGKIVTRVVGDRLDEHRLDGLVWLGVDEIGYGADHRFLTCVADHATGAIVWAAPGRNAASLQAFFDALTDEQKASIRAVSIDMSAGYEKAIRDEETGVPHAQVCFDPFHVIQLGGRAVDKVRRSEWNAHGRSGTPQGTWIKGTRWSLIKDPANQTVGQLAKLAEVMQTNKRLFRSMLLLNELRWVYRVPRDEAPERLEAWLAWASRSKLKPFVTLARTIRKHKPGVLAAIELGLSNGRLEGLNSKVRLLSHRAYGFASADALIATIYLCAAGITIPLPHR